MLLLGSQVRERSLKSWRGGYEVEVHFTLLRVCLPSLKLGQGIQPLLGKGFEHFHGKKMHFLTEPSCSEGEEEGGGERAQEGNGRGQEVTL